MFFSEGLHSLQVGPVVHPSLLGSAMVFEVLLEFTLRYTFGGMPACREDDGKPHLHKWPSSSSGTCPNSLI